MFSSDDLDSVPRKFKVAEPLPHEASFFWQILAGIVKTRFLSDEGSYTTLGYWGQDDVIGGALHNDSVCDMICVTTVVVQKLPIENRAEITDCLIRQTLRTQKLLSIHGGKRIHKRFQGSLLWLAERFGQTTPEGCRINVPLTHEELSELVGTSRVTITRCLSELVQSGYVARTGKIYTLTPLAFQVQDWFRAISSS